MKIDNYSSLNCSLITSSGLQNIIAKTQTSSEVLDLPTIFRKDNILTEQGVNKLQTYTKAETDVRTSIVDQESELLRKAMGSDRLDIVDILIKYGNNPLGWPALNYAANQGDIHAVILLTEHGANPNTADIEGSTALHRALESGNISIAKFLMSRGANIHLINNSHESSLHFAVISNVKEVVSLALNEGLDPCFNTGNSCWENNAINLACFLGKTESLKTLINLGIDIKDTKFAPMHSAAAGGNLDIIKLLVLHGVSLNFCSFGWYPQTPLQCAAASGHVDVLKYIFDVGIGFPENDPTGCNTLYRTLAGNENIKGRVECVRYLLDKGVVIQKSNYEFWSALLNTSSEVLSVLLEKKIIYIDDVIANDRTLLTYSLSDLDKVKFLLKQGADVNAGKSKALHNAAYYEDPFALERIKLLLTHGADVNAVDDHGRRPLFYAQHPEVKKLLMQHGAKL